MEFPPSEQTRVFPTTADIHLSWDVAYESGILLCRDREREVVMIRELHIAGEPTAVRLLPDHKELKATGLDVLHVQIEFVDAWGRVVPMAGNRIELSVSGGGMLIGTFFLLDAGITNK